MPPSAQDVTGPHLLITWLPHALSGASSLDSTSDTIVLSPRVAATHWLGFCRTVETCTAQAIC
jgi:hypothetical protein